MKMKSDDLPKILKLDYWDLMVHRTKEKFVLALGEKDLPETTYIGYSNR
jgi:hypothetical protein